MTSWTKYDHERAAFRPCPKPCIGGRMAWTWAEPQWQMDLGLVGVCTHCGTQVFTADVLNEVILNQPKPSGQKRKPIVRSHDRGYQGGWKNNHRLFKAAS